MRLIIAKDYSDVSRKAANIIAAQIQLKPECVLGLATGSSPVGTYQELIAKYQAGDLDFSQVKTLNLDEYVGLPKDHDQSYAYFMRCNLFDHVNIDQNNCNIPNGMNPDADAECARYDAVIDGFGGADLQLLGLGPNGHIGFNEPADAFAKGTNHVKLTDSTIDANQRFFEKREDVPTPRLHHGHRLHHEGQAGTAGGQRRKEGPGREGLLLWPHPSSGSRLHPAAAPRLHPGG